MTDEKYDLLIEKVIKQGLDFSYKSENTVAQEYIKWFNDWVNEKIDRINKRIDSVETKEIIIEETKLRRCMLLEQYIKKIESEFNNSLDFEFFSKYKELYRAAAIACINMDYELNHQYSKTLSQYRDEFDKIKRDGE